MDLITNPLPSQFARRAATARFIVDLELYFYKQDFAGDVRERGGKSSSVDLPAPPDHLNREAVVECRAIASMLTLAQKNKYQVTWDAECYTSDLRNVVSPKEDLEDRLMVKYPPLIGVGGLLKFEGINLPLVVGPAIVTDVKDRMLLWSLPGVLSARRQSKILAATHCLEAQLTARAHHPEDPETKNWPTDDNFFSPGVQWKSGSTLLYPAGFEQGHMAPEFRPAPSADAKTARAHDWMVEFEESGGLLDGILAVAHPELYAAAQEVMTKLCMVHPPSTFVMQTWPTSFTSVQVISNGQTPWHRDLSSMPGWPDFLLSVGSYGQDAVLEARTLGISLPYDSGSIVLLSSKLLLHGVPKVAHDRLLYALYLNKAVFESLKIPLPGMATGAPPIPRSAERPADIARSAVGLRARATTAGGHGTRLRAKEGSSAGADGSSGQGKSENGGEIETERNGMAQDGRGRTGEDSDHESSCGTGDGDGSLSGEGGGHTGGDEQLLSDVDMLGDQSAA